MNIVKMKISKGKKMKSINKIIVKEFLPIILMALILIGFANAQSNESQTSKSNLKIFVQYNLAKNKLLTNDNIKVDVEGNQIILSGTVQTLYAKNKAASEASSVDEKYTVVNNLNIETPALPDNEVENEVNKKIHSNLFYGVYDWVTVSANNGIVTLKGWVHLPWLKSQFQTEAEKVVGVKSVDNKIENTFGPGEIGVRAARLIYNDPMFEGMQYFSDPPIHIIVNNGSVILEGTVNSEVQSSWAANLVRFRTDAFSVQNDLKVK